MSTPITVVEGVVKEDGTLEVLEKLAIPAGRVQVTVVPLPELSNDDPFWQMMQGIWAGQKSRGQIPRSVEEVEAERRAFRDEWEERMSRLESLREEARKSR
jgi:hypothetical protein